MGFIDDNFLLETDFARSLYHGHAKGVPIVDFHNHLPVKDLCADRIYPDIGTLWVVADPYKHRAMRLMGLEENLISGKASPKEKFGAWCGIVPHLAGNPLFHWSYLEMLRFFDYDGPIDEAHSAFLWEHCNRLLAGKDHSMTGFLKAVNAKRLTTSDDLLDDTSLHKKASEATGIDITPSLRGDSILGFSKAFMEKLAPADSSLEAFLKAVSERLDSFEANGCRLSDHSLDDGFTFVSTPGERAAALFEKLPDLDTDGLAELKSFVLEWLGRQYASRKWVMQLHIGAQRHTSTRLRSVVGPAGGYASPGSCLNIRALCDFLDALDSESLLPRTILYNLNPADNAALANLTGSFSESGTQKVKFGPAWWFCDHMCGIEANLETLAAHSLLSQAVGMTTDSRSVLSFSRHEYFRRILCNWLGEKVRRGHLPADESLLGGIVEDICYSNANKWIYEQR